jgi:hypothetical protein
MSSLDRLKTPWGLYVWVVRIYLTGHIIGGYSIKIKWVLLAVYLEIVANINYLSDSIHACISSACQVVKMQFLIGLYFCPGLF